MNNPAMTSRSLLLPLGSDPDLRRRYMVVTEELQGNLRFGLLLEVLDKLAEETSLAYVRREYPDARVVTAAIDSIFIRNPGDVTRDLALHARINYVGTSSLEVGIRIEHPADPSGSGRASVHIASCYFTMVARSGSGADATSLPLPGLAYDDALEMQRRDKAIASRQEYRNSQVALQEPPSREEYMMLQNLHAAQEQPGFAGHPASRMAASSWERMYPEQENVPSTIFGGYLIRRAYEIAAVCAEEVATDRPVIVAVNRINFMHPVRLDDKLHYKARVIYTGTTSLTVEVAIERISRDRSVRALSNSCLFTFVNVDGNLSPRPVSQVYPSTYGEDARFLQGYRQHQAYRAGRQEGKFHH